MRSLRHVAVAVAALASMASVSQAQYKTGDWYIGGTLGVSLGLGDPQTLTIAIPMGGVSVGRVMSDKWSLEPTLGWLSIAAKDNTAFSVYTLDVGIPLMGVLPNMTLVPFVGTTGGSGGGDNQMRFGVSVRKALKTPGNGIELGFAHTSQPDPLDALNDIYLAWKFHTKWGM